MENRATPLFSRSFSAWLIVVSSLLAFARAADSPLSTSTPSPSPMTPASGTTPPTTPTSVARTPAMDCVSTTDRLFKFVLTSHRNGTGHWIADMDVQHDPGAVATEEHPFELQLEHHTTACASCEDPGPVYARLSVHEPPPIRTPSAGGYRYFPGFGFYKRHTQLMNWRSARAACRAEGADLVVINSEDEAKLLLELSAPLLFLQPSESWNQEAYIGVFDFDHEGHFITVTGQSLNETGYLYWSKNEPNNFREEDCVTIVRNAMLNDVQCNTLFEFICEIEE